MVAVVLVVVVVVVVVAVDVDVVVVVVALKPISHTPSELMSQSPPSQFRSVQLKSNISEAPLHTPLPSHDSNPRKEVPLQSKPLQIPSESGSL